MGGAGFCLLGKIDTGNLDMKHNYQRIEKLKRVLTQGVKLSMSG